jgi:hypothetical protein
MSDSVMVPRAEMKFAIAQAIWEIDRNESTGARTLMVAAQNLLTAASTPVGGWEDISSLARQMMAGKGAMGAVVDGLPEDVCELHADNLNALLDAIDVKSLHAILTQTEKGS